MSKIIPYSEGLYTCNGGFINPEGKVHQLTYGTHEDFANSYVKGSNYNKLWLIKHDASDFWTYDEFKMMFNLPEKKEEIDEFSSSKLNKEELELFKRWLLYYEKLYGEDGFCPQTSNFLVGALSWDKVETLRGYTITTASPIPHVRLFNYYLMDWNLDSVCKIVYNQENDSVDFVDPSNQVTMEMDYKYQCEADEIKRKVKIEERPLFFK